MLDPSRTGFAEYAGNQNLRGTIARLLPAAEKIMASGLAMFLSVVCGYDP